MKKLLSAFVIIVLACAVVLVLLGARPADLLQIPGKILNDVLSKKQETAAQAEPSPSAAQPPAAPPSQPPAQAAQPVVAGAAPAPVRLAPADNAVDLAALSNTPSEWPKTVELKGAVEFPAVLDGRVVGKVKAPPGVHARLVVIRGNKLGVEYQGGGAMVDVSETDLIQQVLAGRHH